MKKNMDINQWLTGHSYMNEESSKAQNQQDKRTILAQRAERLIEEHIKRANAISCNKRHINIISLHCSISEFSQKWGAEEYITSIVDAFIHSDSENTLEKILASILMHFQIEQDGLKKIVVYDTAKIIIETAIYSSKLRSKIEFGNLIHIDDFEAVYNFMEDIAEQYDMGELISKTISDVNELVPLEKKINHIKSILQCTPISETTLIDIAITTGREFAYSDAWEHIQEFTEYKNPYDPLVSIWQIGMGVYRLITGDYLLFVPTE